MKIKTIFWDFDGVIVESNSVRENGFRLVLKDFPNETINALLEFHRKNGGLSRYVKFRYFFEEILGQKAEDAKIQELATAFSNIMKKSLIDKKILIDSTYQFILKNCQKFKFHIVSGSDEEELNYLCCKLGIEKYFISIKGSPTPKIQLVEGILRDFKYPYQNCILIGDSMNDYEAAYENNIKFWGFNNAALKAKFPNNYIENYIALEK